MSIWAFRFLLWFIVILLVQPQNRFTFLYPLRIANLSALLAMGMHLMAAMSEKRPLARMGGATIIAFLLLAFGFMSNYAGPLQPDSGWNYPIDLLLKTCVVVILIEAMATSEKRVWALQAVSVLAILWWVKAGIRLSSAGATYAGDRIMGAAVSLIENPNGYAYYLCFYTPLYFYFYQQERRLWLKMAYLFCVLSSVYIVLQTGSRAGLILLMAMGVFTVPRLALKEKKFLILLAVVGFLLMRWVSPGNIERFRTIGHSLEVYLMGGQVSAVTPDEKSSVERYYRNLHTWGLIQRYPLGVGMNPDASLLPDEYFFAAGKAHNEFLMAGRMMGYPGMMLYLFAVFLPMFWGWKILKNPRLSRGYRDMGWLFMVQSFIILVGGNFGPGVFNYPHMIMLASASALWMNLKQEGLIQ